MSDMKPKILKVTQISMVVEDLDATIKNFEKGYGIGPWELSDGGNLFFEPGTVVVHGEPVEYEFRLALYRGLNVDIELIQPLDDKSVYSEFLKENGQGLHHIAVAFEDEQDYINTVEERGNKMIQTGIIINKSKGKKMRATYHDMRNDIGAICEIIHDVRDL